MPNVMIGCKLPHGLILELIPAPPADRTLQGFVPAGKRVTIKGANSLRTERRAQQGVHPFAITPVDKDFWEAWYAQHKDRDFVKNGLVFVAKDEKDAQAMARERLPERTGLEGLNTDLKNEPRMPKSSNPNTTVEADREHLKSLGVAA